MVPEALLKHSRAFLTQEFQTLPYFPTQHFLGPKRHIVKFITETANFLLPDSLLFSFPVVIKYSCKTKVGEKEAKFCS